jgi:hypothetical protein
MLKVICPCSRVLRSFKAVSFIRVRMSGQLAVVRYESEIDVVGDDDFSSWVWTRSLLEAEPFDLALTIDPVRYRTTARRDDGTPFFDYDGDEGDTLRFGDGDFGRIPDPSTIFRVVYRVGGGALGNVAADAINRIEEGTALAAMATAVFNPFAATGGADREPAETVRRLAPQRHRTLARQHPRHHRRTGTLNSRALLGHRRLLHDDVDVGPAHAEPGHPGPARPAGLRPRLRFADQPEIGEYTRV